MAKGSWECPIHGRIVSRGWPCRECVELDPEPELLTSDDEIHLPLLEPTYTTRARSTGATCSVVRTEDGWGTHCATHGTLALVRNRSNAGSAVSRPQEWCNRCALIANGEAPKIGRNDA